MKMLLPLLTGLLLASTVLAAEQDLRLWYTSPATKWEHALPLGNGRLGAMVFGGVRDEHLQLNEDITSKYHPDRMEWRLTPKGWLRHQLELDAQGMVGRMPEISRFVKFEGNDWVAQLKEGVSAGMLAWDVKP